MSYFFIGIKETCGVVDCVMKVIKRATAAFGGLAHMVERSLCMQTTNFNVLFFMPQD